MPPKRDVLYTADRFGAGRSIGSGGDAPVAAVQVDFNHDGLSDLVVANNGDGHISLLEGGEEGPTLPETAQSQYPEVVAKRYAKGEWIFGVCEDSHSSPWGGTVVVKDSRGQVRAFFGHVCGSRALEIGLQQSDSLDGFYRSDWLRGFGFTEYTFP